MQATIKGQFLNLESRPNRGADGKPDGTYTDYAKLYCDDEIAPVKLPDGWQDTDLAMLQALKMGDYFEIEVKMNCFNGRIYYKKELE